MNGEPHDATPRRLAGFQFGLFHLFAVMTIASMMLSVLRVIQLPPLFLAVVGGYLAVYVVVRGPFLAVKLSRLWQRRQQLLVERQHLEQRLLERLRARGQVGRQSIERHQSSDDGRSRNKLTL